MICLRLKISLLSAMIAAWVMIVSACADLGAQGATPGRTAPAGTASPVPRPGSSPNLGGDIGGGANSGGSGAVPSPSASGGPAASSVQAVTLQPESVTLNAPAADPASASLAFDTYRQFTARVVFLDRAAGGNADVTWESSDPSRVTVDEGGLARVLATAPEGSVLITARARRDPKRLATASITVKRDTEFELVVD